jgi:hypothetical protein
LLYASLRVNKRHHTHSEFPWYEILNCIVLSLLTHTLKQRPLPQALLQEWTTDTFKLTLWKSNDDSTKFVFDVSSGVDEELLALNLSALANIPKVLFKREAEVQKTPTPYFIAQVLLAWFVGMGITVPTLRTWLMQCVKEHFETPDVHPHTHKEEFASLESHVSLLDKFFKELESATITHTEPTLYPLPSFVDVRLLEWGKQNKQLTFFCFFFSFFFFVFFFW